jgi:shikimate dehydrogenase
MTSSIDRYAVFGNPIAHSKSPRIHALFAQQTGQLMRYDARLAPVDGFDACVHDFIATGGRGANVTVPFKEDAYRLCALPGNRLSARARAAGAVNTLLMTDGHIEGDNTDGAGLVRDITVNRQRALKGARVLLLGAGGAARGCVLPILSEAPACVHIANRTLAKAQAMFQQVSAGDTAILGINSGEIAGEITAVSDYASLADAPAFDLIINATSAGLSDAPLPLPDTLFAAHTLAYDMLYGRQTPFMTQAQRCGAQVADGLGMLVEQAGEAFWRWRGVRPDTRAVLAALRESL